MKIPLSWLKDYVNINIGERLDIKQFADIMTQSGSKVEAIEHLGREITNVVVGRIDKILPHPNADKLVITQIDIGEAEHKQIVTGATNLTEGDYIPVALHGAQLAGGSVIKKGKIRGEASDGMLCSIEELGYTRADYPEAPEDGIYIFGEPQPLGADARPILGLLDTVLEFELTSNRPDCYSVIGLAREAAAALNYELRITNYELRPVEGTAAAADAAISVEVRDSLLCPRYIGRVVRNVRIGTSPQWMRRRLIAAGLRPVNNIVDITNYVMLEYGQPMHAFDIRAVDGRIVVRTASDGEKIITLDGAERVLDGQMLVIADENKAIGIAGVMGGEGSKINDDTTTILLESANFCGDNIRQTSKKLGLRTDSSSRYEKGLDPNLAEICINRACQLIAELGAGEIAGEMTDVYPTPLLPHKVPFATEQINNLLGLNLTCQEIDDILARLDITVADDHAIIPTYRNDIQIWQDLAEEVGRLYGYDNIPTVVAASSNVGKPSHAQIMEDKLTEIAIALGYSQTLTYAFESPKVFDKLLMPEGSILRNAVRITNPLGEDTGIMRTTMLNSILTSLSTNYAKRNDEVMLFEIANVYRPKPAVDNTSELPTEGRNLVMGYYGNKGFFHLKGALEAIAAAFGVPMNGFRAVDTLPFFHPGQCGRLFANIDGNEVALATCGRIHPTVTANYDIGKPAYVLAIYLEQFFAVAQIDKSYTPMPRFPEVYRDIALVVPKGVTNGELTAAINAGGDKYLKHVGLFDVYEGANLPDGTKSLAYNLAFQAVDRTLTDEEITKAMSKILRTLETDFDAKLRG